MAVPFTAVLSDSKKWPILGFHVAVKHSRTKVDLGQRMNPFPGTFEAVSQHAAHSLVGEAR